MTALKSLLIAALVALPAFALAQGSLPDVRPAVFCDAPYALCIKAPCVPVVNASGDITSLACSCDVKAGWSMGPGSCQSRTPVQKNGATFMISTYSNFYNLQHKTMACNTATPWGWCYGAPCLVSPDDPTKATCTCPLGKQTSMQTLGGTCGTTGGGCNGYWSAATPVDDTFANTHYYKYMTDNHPSYPAQPEAQMCPVPSAVK